METNTVGMITLEIIPNKNSKCIFGFCYKPLNVTNTVFIMKMTDISDKYFSTYDDIFVTGDLNLDMLNKQEIVFKKDKATLHVISKRCEDKTFLMR